MSFYLFYYKRKQKSRQHRQFFINFLVFPPRTIYNCFNMRAQSAWTRRKKESAALSALSFQRVKKVCDFFARFKKRHIFCENKFSRKISLRSSKSLMNQAFLMAIIRLRAGPLPPRAPLLRLRFSSAAYFFDSLKIFFFSVICAAQPHTYSYPLSSVGYQLAAVSAAASIPSCRKKRIRRCLNALLKSPGVAVYELGAGLGVHDLLAAVQAEVAR